jgi:hypothetical protein
VAALSIRVLELERLLAAERAVHAREIRDQDQRWQQVLEEVRREGQAERRKATKLAARRSAVEEREAQARAGGCARNAKLSAELKSEIGRRGAGARWARWRERHGATGK